MVGECKAFRSRIDANGAMLAGIDNSSINTASIIRNVDSSVFLQLLSDEHGSQ